MNTTATASRTTVVVPARNEARHLARLVPALVAAGHQVVVVDGGSLDQTAAVARAAGAVVFSAPRATRDEAVALGRTLAHGEVVVLDADATIDAPVALAA